MNERESIYLSLPDDTKHRFNLYKSLFRLWVFRENQELTAYKISEMLDIPVDIVLADLSVFEDAPQNALSGIRIESVAGSIDKQLGVKPLTESLLIGVGKLGTSLLKNPQLTTRVKVVAAFDINPEIVGGFVSGLKIQDMSKLQATVRQLHLKMAIIATTPSNAQIAVNQACDAGITVVWNFTPVALEKGEGVKLHNTSAMHDIESDYLKIFSKA